MHPHCCLPTTHQMQQGVPRRATQLWHKHNTHTPALEAVLLSIAPQLSASTCAQAQPHVGQILLELPNVRNLHHHCMASALVTSSASRQQHTHAPPQQTESCANNARTNLALHQPQVNIGDILSCAKQRSRAVCMPIWGTCRHPARGTENQRSCCNRNKTTTTNAPADALAVQHYTSYCMSAYSSVVQSQGWSAHDGPTTEQHKHQEATAQRMESVSTTPTSCTPTPHTRTSKYKEDRNPLDLTCAPRSDSDHRALTTTT